MVEYSESVQGIIDKLRRRISDDEQPYAFSDERLYGYVVDAVDHLEAGPYKRGYKVKDGNVVRSSGNESVELTGAQQSIYSIQAAIIFIRALKSEADRDNFLLRKPNLTLDMTQQSRDHLDSITSLENELKSYLREMAFNMGGFRIDSSAAIYGRGW